jgi:CDP-diacylglycerol pyrophosphatase
VTRTGAWVAGVVAGCVALSIGFVASQARHRDALRRIVQTECLPAFLRHHDPAPCVRLVLPPAGGVADGYAVLKDRKPGAHFLLIPTRTLAGLESPEMRDPHIPNFLAAAWTERKVLDHWLGRTLPRDAVGLAINPHAARGQDQLHVHIECVGALLERVLSAHAGDLGSAWTPLSIAGRPFVARSVMGERFDGTNPIRLLADDLPGGGADLGAYTVVVAGRSFAAGPGVVVLAAKGAPGGETLLDARCAVAGAAAGPLTPAASAPAIPARIAPHP